MSNKQQAVITGYAVVQPDSYRRVSRTPELHCEVPELNRKLARFACRSAAAGIAASEQAISMAGLAPTDLGTSFCLYTNQSGLQHADIDDFQSAFSDLPSDAEVYDWLWQSKSVSPFLVIKSLSNNLLGLLSMHWKVTGDCAAFVRDEHGAAAALDEALFNIEQGYVERALVVSAGTETDAINAVFNRCQAATVENTEKVEIQCGAVALLLESQSVLAKSARNSLAAINRNITPQSGVHFAADHQQRWGGVLFSIAQSLHEQSPLQQSEIESVTNIDVSANAKSSSEAITSNTLQLVRSL